MLSKQNTPNLEALLFYMDKVSKFLVFLKSMILNRKFYNVTEFEAEIFQRVGLWKNNFDILSDFEIKSLQQVRF